MKKLFLALLLIASQAHAEKPVTLEPGATIISNLVPENQKTTLALKVAEVVRDSGWPCDSLFYAAILIGGGWKVGCDHFTHWYHIDEKYGRLFISTGN